MSFWSYILNKKIDDTGSYIHDPVYANNLTIGNQDGLRFIMQALHSNDGMIQGGTGKLNREDWGGNGSDDIFDYCNWLNGTAEAGNPYTLQPNSPVGYPSDTGTGPSYAGAGPKQHILLCILSDDDWTDILGNPVDKENGGNGPAVKYEFTLQGIFRAEEFTTTANFHSWLSTVTDTTWYNSANGVASGNFDVLASGGQAPYTNHENLTVMGDRMGLMDVYVPFVSLFDPDPNQNYGQFNPALANYDWEDEATGQVLFTFGTPGDRFKYPNAVETALAFFDSVVSTLNPNFNNFTDAQKKSRIFITNAPIQTGTHKTTNKYVREFLTNQALTLPEIPVPNAIYGTLQEAIYQNGLQTLYTAGTYAGFDHECQSWWNLIIEDRVLASGNTPGNNDGSNTVQHVGNVNYNARYGTGATIPMLNNTAPALDASSHCYATTYAGLYHTRTIGGGILKQESNLWPDPLTPILQQGMSLHTDYQSERFASPYLLPDFRGGIKLFPDNGPSRQLGTDMGNEYRIINLSVQNFDENSQGIGNSVNTSFSSVPAIHTHIPPFIYATEDVSWVASGASKNKTSATYTGHIYSVANGGGSAPWHYTGNLVDVQHQVEYSPMNILNQHSILSFEGTGWNDQHDVSAGGLMSATMSPSALWFNMSATCWGGAPAPSITAITVAAVGCTGNPANGEVHITTDFAPINLQNAHITWTHEVGSLPSYNAGNTNHTGLYDSAVTGGATLTNQTGGAGVVTGLTAGPHTFKVCEFGTNCCVTTTITVPQVSGSPPIVTGTVTNDTCMGGEGSIDIDVIGGTAPYTYEWTDINSGQIIGTTQDLINLPPGSYSVVVDDAAGCQSATALFTVLPTTSGLAVADAPTITYAACGAGGTIDIQSNYITWPVGDYWDVTATVTNSSGIIVSTYIFDATTVYPIQMGPFPDDTYTVDYMDSDGCTDSSTYTIQAPVTIAMTTTVTPGSCGGTSSVSLQQIGGTGPFVYEYAIAGSGSWIVAASSVISGLADGNYDFQITDSLGCYAQDLNVTITTGAAYSLLVQTQEASCFGNLDGSAQFVFLDAGGIALPVSDWTILNYNSGTTTVAGLQTVSGVTEMQVDALTAATYDAVATHTTTGCTAEVTYIIGQPDDIAIISTHSDVSCGGTNDGAITLVVSGGSPAYTFAWTLDGVAIANTTATATSLAAGDYIIIVTDTLGCTAQEHITITGDDAEVVSVVDVNPPLCVGGTDGSFEITCANGDFPFEVWFSTDNVTFLQIESLVPGNTGLVDEFDSIDLAGLAIDTTWIYTIAGTNISLPENLTFYVKLISVANSCPTTVVSDTIPLNANSPLTLTTVVADASCCDECGGVVTYTFGGGLTPAYTFTLSTLNAATSPTDPTIATFASWIFPVPSTLSYSNLCPGDYTLTMVDQCGISVHTAFTIASNPLLITDIQYAHPYCDNCFCGSITVEASGGDGLPLVYTCNDGLHWVDTDPASLANGPSIFNITNYNASTITPGTWTPGSPPGWANLDDGIYRIWVRDHSPCPSPVFDDPVSDCNPGGPLTCVNFCTDCTANGCYADFVDVFADHSIAPWNGGTKLELENLSELNVVTTAHSGPTIMGGNNGVVKFAVLETFWWPGMTWNIEVFIMDPATSSLSYTSDLTSPYYGDVCCDVPGTGSCATDCCDDITSPFTIGATTPTADPNLVICSTTPCASTNTTPWAFTLEEVLTNTELCPTPDGSLNSLGVYTYNPTIGQMGAYVEFEISNISIVGALSPADMEAMVIVRVTNNLSTALPTVSYSGISGCIISTPSVNCDDCAASVLDNGMLNIIGIWGAENCDCGCPPGYILDDNQYIDDGQGSLILNPDYNTCIGFDSTLAPLYGSCFDASTGLPILAGFDPVSCSGLSGTWLNNWTAATITQNMPCCVGGILWGTVGAKLYGDWTSGLWTGPVPVGQDPTLLPYTQIGFGGEGAVQDTASNQLTTDPSWTQSFPVYQTRLIDTGIWAAPFTQYPNNTDNHTPINSWIGITVCTEDLLSQQSYILALAGSHAVEFLVDGNVYISLNLPDPATNQFWNLFPIALSAGTHTLEFRGLSVAGPAVFAFELYSFMVGGVPTVSYLANPAITAADLQNITIADYAGNPISSEHYIGKDFHTTTNQSVGFECPGNDFVTPCGGVMMCSTTDQLDIDCPECEEDLEDIIGCVGNLVTPVYDKIVGGMSDNNTFYTDARIAWGVLLIRYLIKRFAKGLRSCITPEKIVIWTKFLANICPDCESNVKTIDEVNYLPDPNESSSPISGIDGAEGINTFDF